MDKTIEKIIKFNVDCESQAKKDADALNLSTDKEIFKRTKNMKEELRRNNEIELNKKLKKLEKEYNSEVVKIDTETRLEILKKEEELSNEIINILRNKIIDYTYSNSYKEYLFCNIDNVLKNIDSNTNKILYLTKKDIDKFKDELEAKYNNMEFLIMDDNYIGGFKCFQTQKNILYDNSLKTLIEEKQ